MVGIMKGEESEEKVNRCKWIENGHERGVLRRGLDSSLAVGELECRDRFALGEPPVRRKRMSGS